MLHQPPSLSRSSSGSSYDPSFLSSLEHTAFSDGHRYIDQESPKSLPAIPSDQTSYGPDIHRIQTPFHDPRPQLISQPHIHPLTSITQLAAALGPDNTHYSTEIATIPCAGVRIPHGPLSGLIAWRLVVNFPLPVKGKRGWWNDDSAAATKKARRDSSTPKNFSFTPAHSHSYSDILAPPRLTWASTSAISLPFTAPPLHMHSTDNFPRPQSSLSRTSHVRSARIHTRPPHLDNTAVVSNFILDTSLPYSIISRDTLIELGYPSHELPSPYSSNPHSGQWQDDRNPDAIVTLSIQNIPTRLRIARPGEASRLGVQFLQDAGVSIFFPRDGEAVGPVLYLDSSYLLKEVPRTITSFPDGTRATKLSLPQRVLSLFGLA